MILKLKNLKLSNCQTLFNWSAGLNLVIVVIVRRTGEVTGRAEDFSLWRGCHCHVSCHHSPGDYWHQPLSALALVSPRGAGHLRHLVTRCLFSTRRSALMSHCHTLDREVWHRVTWLSRHVTLRRDILHWPLLPRLLICLAHYRSLDILSPGNNHTASRQISLYLARFQISNLEHIGILSRSRVLVVLRVCLLLLLEFLCMSV